jgi:hypothetical protein
VSTSTVQRALRRRGLLLPRGYRADRRSWARLRRQVFHEPPSRRNRMWQTDFSEFEIHTEGDDSSLMTWRVGQLQSRIGVSLCLHHEAERGPEVFAYLRPHRAHVVAGVAVRAVSLALCHSTSRLPPIALDVDFSRQVRAAVKQRLLRAIRRPTVERPAGTPSGGPARDLIPTVSKAKQMQYDTLGTAAATYAFSSGKRNAWWRGLR